MEKQLLKQLNQLPKNTPLRVQGLFNSRSKVLETGNLVSLDLVKKTLTIHNTVYNSNTTLNTDDIIDIEYNLHGQSASLQLDRPSYFNTGTQAHNGGNIQTGEFDAYLPVTTLVGNAGRGPSLALNYYYSAGVAFSMGGWAPRFSYVKIDKGNIKLHLYTGQILTIFKALAPYSPQPGLTIKEFSLTQSNASSSRIKILHKDGTVEVLEDVFDHSAEAVAGFTEAAPDSFLSACLVPTRITNSIGYSLYFEWTAKPGKPIILSKVSDETQVLLKTTALKKATSVAGKTLTLDALEFIERPEQSPVTLATLYLQETKLIKYERNNGLDADAQEFTYTGQNLTTLQHSRKTKEVIAYSADNRITRYTLSEPNTSSNRVEDFTFTASTAKQVLTFDKTTITTELLFDDDDLLSKTTTTQGDYVQTVEIKRGIDTTTNQLSLHTLTTYKNEYSDRTEIASSTFDTLGNLIKKTENDITTEYTYYRGQAKEEEMVLNTSTYTDTSGFHGKLGWVLDYMNPVGWGFLLFGKQGMTWGTVEKRAVVHSPYLTNTGTKAYNLPVTVECPGDPNYFRINVESEKRYRMIDGKRVDLRWTFYGYSSLTTRDPQVAGPAIKPCLKLIIHDPQSDDNLKLKDWKQSRIVVQETEYYTDAATPSFGRIKSLSQRLLDSAGKDIPLSAQKTSYGYTLEGDTLTTTTSFLASEKTQDVSQVVHSMRSLQLLSSQDSHGNSLRYTYDSYGRMLSKSEQPQEKGPLQQTRFEYSQTQGCPVVTTTFTGGEQYRECYDANGRIATTETRGSNEKDVAWRTLSTTSYDGLGREKLTTEYDYHPDPSRTEPMIKRQLEQFYDNWGQPSKTQVVGGIARYHQYDPVLREKTLKQQYAATPCCDQITRYNALGGIESESFHDTTNSEYYWAGYAHDDAGRINEQSDTNGATLTYDWDAFDRLVKLADPEIENTYEYPVHTTASLASRITLKQTTSEYTYEWGNRKVDGLDRVVGLQTGGRKKTFSYTGSHSWGTLSSPVPDAFDPSQTVSNALTYDASNFSLTRTTINYLNNKTTARCLYSLRGLLLEHTDDFGNTTTYTYDLLGRLISTTGSGVSTTLSHDNDERLIKETVTEATTKTCMTIAYKYDSQHREIERQFSAPGFPTLTLKQGFDKHNRLATSKILRDTTELSQENFAYTSAGQLAVYACSGSQRPTDPQGKKLSKQTFSYTPVGSVQKCISVFDGGEDTATFTYSETDKTQLKSVTHSAAGRAPLTLEYDALGRLVKNEAGYKQRYNSTGQLSELLGPAPDTLSYTYLYDEHGKVSAFMGNSYQENYYYHDDQQYARDGLIQIKGINYYRLSRIANFSNACQLLNQTLKLYGATGSGDMTRSFELKNAMGSVIASYDLGTKAQTLFSYTPFGYRPDDRAQRSWLGFNGEPIDRPTGTYHLGNGARVYNSIIQAFQTPDSLSPFSVGGLNGYAYCSNDPVNFSDPSGHAEVVREYSTITHGAFVQDAIVRASMDLVFGTALAVATGGVSTGFGIATLGLEIVSGSFGIAAAALAERDPHTANLLGWISFGTSITGNALDVGDMIKVGRYATGSLSGMAINAERRAVTALNTTAVDAGSFVTMSGTMRSLKQVDGELYTFVDTYKAKDRLNIAVHGKGLSFVEEKLLNNSSSVILNNAEHSAGDVLQMLNNKGIDPKLYENVRLLICFSGNGGASSFAAQFRSLINRPVKGFVGPVTMNYGSTPMTRMFDSAAQTGPAGTAALADVFAQQVTHKTVKSNPYKFLSDPKLYAGFRYKPVKF